MEEGLNFTFAPPSELFWKLEAAWIEMEMGRGRRKRACLVAAAPIISSRLHSYVVCREGNILPGWFAWKVHRSKSNASELAPHAVDNTKLKLSTGQMLNVIAGLRRTPENNWDSLKSNSVGREQKAPVGVLQEGHIPRKQFLFRWWQNHVAALQYASIF